MNIYVNDEAKTSMELMNLFEKAAGICLREEGLEASNAGISVSFVGPEEIQELNSSYRGVDRVTDVLSFPMYESIDDIDDTCEYLLGDVVICMEKVESQAEEFGHSKERETVYLFTHSILHLLGYDHENEDDKREMRAAEKKVMEEMKISR